MATIESLKADVSSVSPSSERLKELWVVCVCLYAGNGATLLLWIWWLENKIEIIFCLLKAERESEIKPCAKKFWLSSMTLKKLTSECDFWFPQWHEKWHNLIFSSQVRSWVLFYMIGVSEYFAKFRSLCFLSFLLTYANFL